MGTDVTPVRFSAGEMRAALRKAYPAPQWALMMEVRNASGFDANRSADAVAMNTWPSQGLRLVGIEIKVSRADWRNELKDPSKAEAIAQYCDEWVVAAPKGVVPPEEVPEGWTLREWTGERWVTVTQGVRTTEPKPVTRSFLGALLRRASEVDQGQVDALVKSQVSEFEKSFRERVEREVGYRAREFVDLQKKVAEFEAAAGVKISDWDAGNVGAAVKVVQTLQLTSNYHGIFWLLRQLEDLGAKGRAALTDLGIEEPKQIDLFAPKPKRARAT